MNRHQRHVALIFKRNELAEYNSNSDNSGTVSGDVNLPAGALTVGNRRCLFVPPHLEKVLPILGASFAVLNTFFFFSFSFF